ncbi:MAG: alpha/beta hydrolase [Gammaproteobacteria bacterium]|jgi:alpha-beta hydrolase superfamily lysophospholipase|nr:alpha/beta hydrolase [Pseudomonas sp.]MDY0413960.1 alpha/beta hydrolase [Pseudomonas sp.]NLO53139.1 alpha/beta hydrolase [Gammaproteobacteria bacterium]
MNQSHNEKPPVLLVHGMWGNQEALKEVHDAFVEQGYVTESLRLPYHCPKAEHTAASKEKLAQTALQDYVVYIIEQVKRQNSPPILIGHSMGGLLVQLVAAQVPCNRLILLSSAAPAGINGLSLSAIKTFGSNLLRFPLWRSITEVKLASIRYGIANSQSAAVQREIYARSTYESGRATWQISMGLLLGRRSAAYVNTEQIQCPVLIIGGTADRITPINVQRSIAQGFGARGQLVEIPNCCHWTVGGKFFLQIRTEIFQWLNT